MLTSSKSGISAKELERELGVSYESAWLMLHKLRRAMVRPGRDGDKLSGDIAVDESYLGGPSPGGKRGRGAEGKVIVAIAVERKGQGKKSKRWKLGRTRIEVVKEEKSPGTPRLLDEESREWLRSLRSDGTARNEAVRRLHALLLRAARFEVARRRPALPYLRGNELDDIAFEAANDALISVLARLDDFRGASRFTTWVRLVGLNREAAAGDAVGHARKRAVVGRAQIEASRQEEDPDRIQELSPEDLHPNDRLAGGREMLPKPSLDRPRHAINT